MSDSPDIRWKQRFSNLEKAFQSLNSAKELQNPDVFQRAAQVDSLIRNSYFAEIDGLVRSLRGKINQ